MRQGAKTEKGLVMKALNKLIFIDRDTQIAKGSATRKELTILRLHPSFIRYPPPPLTFELYRILKF